MQKTEDSMSAYIVSREHIDALVTAAQSRAIGCANASPFRWWCSNGAGERFVKFLQMHDQAGATAAGRMLWLENLKSVAARYPSDGSGQRPGPCDLTDEEMASYEFKQLPGTPGPVIVLQAIKGLEYQSCEHDDWESSEAKAFLDALRDACIRVLPGMDAAPWEITDRYVFEPGMRLRAVRR